MRLALLIALALPPLDALETWLELAHSPWNRLPKLVAWQKGVPEVEVVHIRASADGADQPALFYDSGSAEKKPLLVVLHSWSDDYAQPSSLPYGRWAVQHDWVFIHPDYRGPYVRPESTGSELAIEDVLDAVAWAKEHANVDADRVYLVGFSGGGMTTLLLASRHPELWSAAVAWVPVFDLVDWYAEVEQKYRSYSRHIQSSCGGVPKDGNGAARECKKRSPSTYIAGAKGRRVQIYVATGLDDPFVSPRHTLAVYNALAAEEARLSAEAIVAIADERRIPNGLPAPPAHPTYDQAGRPLLLALHSENVTLRIFRGRHDVVYAAGLEWLDGHHR